MAVVTGVIEVATPEEIGDTTLAMAVVMVVGGVVAGDSAATDPEVCVY